jgi:hypothetical protein
VTTGRAEKLQLLRMVRRLHLADVDTAHRPIGPDDAGSTFTTMTQPSSGKPPAAAELATIIRANYNAFRSILDAYAAAGYDDASSPASRLLANVTTMIIGPIIRTFPARTDALSAKLPLGAVILPLTNVLRVCDKDDWGVLGFIAGAYNRDTGTGRIRYPVLRPCEYGIEIYRHMLPHPLQHAIVRNARTTICCSPNRATYAVDAAGDIGAEDNAILGSAEGDPKIAYWAECRDECIAAAAQNVIWNLHDHINDALFNVCERETSGGMIRSKKDTHTRIDIYRLAASELVAQMETPVKIVDGDIRLANYDGIGINIVSAEKGVLKRVNKRLDDAYSHGMPDGEEWAARKMFNVHSVLDIRECPVRGVDERKGKGPGAE